MKNLEQLGVSPAPWTAETFANDPSSDGRDIKDALGYALANTQPISGKSIADARLIAAAPDLYEALRKLVIVCAERGYKDGGTAPCYESEHKLYRAIWEAEATLAKAGGAE